MPLFILVICTDAWLCVYSFYVCKKRGRLYWIPEVLLPGCSVCSHWPFWPDCFILTFDHNHCSHCKKHAQLRLLMLIDHLYFVHQTYLAEPVVQWYGVRKDKLYSQEIGIRIQKQELVSLIILLVVKYSKLMTCDVSINSKQAIH